MQLKTGLGFKRVCGIYAGGGLLIAKRTPTGEGDNLKTTDTCVRKFGERTGLEIL